MSTYAIGDVQGCFDELILLLEKINFNTATDNLIFTGDLVNRGPDSLKVLEYLYSINGSVINVLGNHDFHLLVCALYFLLHLLYPKGMDQKHTGCLHPIFYHLENIL